MAVLDDLIPEARTHLSGVPEETVELYLRRAAKQFCRDSLAWDVSLGTRVLAAAPAATARYRLYLHGEAGAEHFIAPGEAYINRVSQVRFTPSGSTPDSKRDVLEEDLYAYEHATRDLILYPGALSGAGTLDVNAVLEPARGAETLPDFLVELRGEGIVEYAIFELMTMPKQEWSDPELAALFKAKYDARVNEATVDKAREGTRKGIELAPFEFN